MPEAQMRLSRPCNRRSVLRDPGDLLVPEMQIDDAVAGAAKRSIRNDDVAVEPLQLDPQDAVRVAAVLDDRLPTPQHAVQPENELLQPMAMRARCTVPIELCVHTAGGATHLREAVGTERWCISFPMQHG